jgi:hypothetical protein
MEDCKVNSTAGCSIQEFNIWLCCKVTNSIKKKDNTFDRRLGNLNRTF